MLALTRLWQMQNGRNMVFSSLGRPTFCSPNPSEWLGLIRLRECSKFRVERKTREPTVLTELINDLAIDFDNPIWLFSIESRMNSKKLSASRRCPLADNKFLLSPPAAPNLYGRSAPHKQPRYVSKLPCLPCQPWPTRAGWYGERRNAD
jgi:hypothetical protein